MTEYMVKQIYRMNGDVSYSKIKAKNQIEALKKLFKQPQANRYHYATYTKNLFAYMMWENEFVFEDGPYKHTQWSDLSSSTKKHYTEKAWRMA